MPNSSLFRRDKSDIIRGGTAVSLIELLIGKQYCFAVIKKNLR